MSSVSGNGGWLAAILLLSMLHSLSVVAAPGVGARLADVVRNGDRVAVREMLKNHVDVNAAAPDGSTALAWAADRNDLETADLLIGAGANLNAVNQYGATPLSVACARGKSAMVQRLLEAEADPNAGLLSGETPLMTSVDQGNLDAVRMLLDHKADPNAKESKGGQTALMWAVADTQPLIAKLLVERGADVHARSKGGFTPLLFAAQQGDAESARILLNAGADVNELTQKERMSALMVAAAGGHNQVALLLLDQRANTNLADARGYTALHYAATNPRRIPLLKALLAHGANPNARTTRDVGRGTEGGISSKGATPLFLAASEGNVEAVRELIAGGADPFLSTENKTTPLHVAAGVGPPQARDWTDEEKKNLFETTKLLVGLGADVNAVGEHGWTPLHGAAYKSIDSVVQLLVEKGAKVDVIDEYGQTPLSIASAVITAGVKDHYYQSARIVRQSTCDLLIKLGAKPLADSGIQIVGIFNEEQ